MNELSLNDLIEKVKNYNPTEVERIKKAYECASKLHDGQIRKSGEPYIIHPLNVAYILASIHADGDTLCAGLLHDTLEDTDVTKQELTEMFGETVAMLVEGVTKLGKKEYKSKIAGKLANTKKIILGFTEDARIIIIKLADRLHNMRTLKFKSKSKQVKIALETMEIFVPLAYYVGINSIKKELEDLALSYLYPSGYKKALKLRNNLEEDYTPNLNEMIKKITKLLDEKNIQNKIEIRIKNIYGVYKRLVLKNRDPHDLIAIKVSVNNIEDCYITLGLIHSLYNPVNDKFKDYISLPKTSMYSALHTTVFGPDERLVQFQIKTFDMNFISDHGLATYWYKNEGDGKRLMKSELSSNSFAFSEISKLKGIPLSDEEFVNKIKTEIFGTIIYVYTPSGERISLPLGSTPKDFANTININISDIQAILVNDIEVPIDYKLKSNDRIRIIRKIRCKNKKK